MKSSQRAGFMKIGVTARDFVCKVAAETQGPGMKLVYRLSIALCAAATAMSPAASADIDKGAYAKYVAGDYDGAVEQSVALGGAGNLTLAARSLNSLAYFGDSRKSNRETANWAFNLAERAAKLDPSFTQAQLEAAIGLSLRAANMSPPRVLALNLPGRARKHLDAALALAPEDVWALSTSAAWRMGVARKGGGSVFGADPEVGHAEFMKARGLAPENVVVAYECARALIASDREEWRATGLEALAVATSGAPESAFEEGVQDLAREFEAAIAEGPNAEDAFIAAQP